MNNKTTAHNRHIFRPLVLLKIRFKKDQNVFSKKILTSVNLDNFSNTKIFWFLQKTLSSGGKKENFMK